MTVASTAPRQAIPSDLLRPAPTRMEPVSMSHSLAMVAPAYWATLTPAEQRLLRHVRIIAGGLLVKVNPPILPQAFVADVSGADTITGSTFMVNAGDNLQTAINNAAAADPDLNHEIVIQAGATFTGNFQIPVKAAAGLGWVTIRSSASASLPARGTRITTAHAALMPKIVSANLASPITINDSVTRRKEGWRLLGIEAYFLPSVTSLIYAPIVGFGWGVDGGNQNTQAAIDVMQRRLAIERCYVHYSVSSQNQKVGVRIMGDDVQVRDSIITGQAQGAEGIAIQIDAGAAVLIENNELRGAGQNIYFNCDRRAQDESIWSQTRPRDVIIRRNYLWKEPRWYKTDPAWDGLNWTQKPGIEIKYLGGLRVLIEGNVFWNIWSWGPIHLSTTSTTDVTIQHNRFEHCKSMFTIWDTTSQGITAPASGVRRVKFFNNLGLDLIRVPNAGGYDNGNWGQILPSTNTAQGSQTSDLWFEHNTIICTEHGGAVTVTGKIDRLRFANNIFGYFLAKEGTWDGNDFAIQNRMVLTPGDGDVIANAMLRTFLVNTGPPYTQAQWGPPNSAAGEWIIAGTPEEAGVSRSEGALSGGSPLKAISVDFDNVPDGSDLGVDFVALAAAQGIGPIPAPRPTILQLTSATTQENKTMPWTVKFRAGILDTQGNMIGQPDAIAHRLYRDGVKIDEQPKPPTGPAEFTLTIPEPEITLNLGVTGLDAAGNENTPTPLIVPLDAKAPAPTKLQLVSATWVAG